MTHELSKPTQAPEVAYYYPEWRWSQGEYGWVKSLLLFFDEIALLVPTYMGDLPAQLDPVLAGALRDRGLLRIIRPETFVDGEMATHLTSAMKVLIESGAFDDLDNSVAFPELSMSRAGFGGNRSAARDVLALLEDRSLARETADGVSIPMHPTVRSTYLVLLAQLARKAGQRQGFDLYPTTNDARTGRLLVQTLELPPMPTRGRVADFDMATVGIDLEDASLEKVLDFREENSADHRRYMEDLRRYCREVSAIDNPAERERALLDRQEELREAAEALTQRAWKSLKRPKNSLLFGLGIVGAVLTHGALPLAVALGTPLLGLIPDRSDDSVYSYLFAARREL
jgi:hypothetical protein